MFTNWITAIKAHDDDVDTLTKLERSERMSKIRSKNTKPERLVRSALHKLGYRFRIHARNLPGAPDIVFPSRKQVIFIHGCFWHAHENCSVANLPKTRRPYWRKKFARNKERDATNVRALRKLGWRVFTIWECETSKPDKVAQRLSRRLGPPGKPSNA
ncbi:very short patch repair endonuclease [Bradyrhizobium lupini]